MFQNTNDPNLLNDVHRVYDSSDDIQLDELPSEFIIKLTAEVAAISSAGIRMSSISK